MTIIIIIAVVIFLWWSLVPAKPRQRNLNDFINESQEKSKNYSNVYRTKMVGQDVYYSDNAPREINDVKVYTGTENNCDNYIYLKNN